MDISGLTLAEAAAKLNAADAAILARPVMVSSAGHRFNLVPAKVGFKFDALRTARRAFQQGYQPHHGPLDVNLYVSYDKQKVTAFARTVIAGVTIAPRDARVHIKLTHIAKVASRTGRTLKFDPLKAAVRAALIDPRVSRTVKPKLVRTQPKVTTAGLAKAYGTVITIDRSTFTLRLFKHLKVAKTYRVAVGQPAYPDADRPVQHRQQGRQPGLDGAEQPVGRRLRERDRGRRLGGEPAEGPLDGDRQRRRHPRHGRAGLDRLGGLARLHPHDRAGRHRSVPAGAGRDSGPDRGVITIYGARRLPGAGRVARKHADDDTDRG